MYRPDALSGLFDPTRKPDFKNVALDRQHPINRGLQGLWLLGENGGAKAYDLSTNRNHGTLTNITPGAGAYTRGPRGGRGLKFASASDQYVDCGNSTSLQITGDMTISAWINPAALPQVSGNDMMIFAKDADSGGRAYTFDYSRDNTFNALRIYINGGGGSNLLTPHIDLTVGGFTHVVATYSTAGILTLYVNGAQLAQGSGADSSIPGATTNVLIGRRGYAGFTSPWDGAIENVRIYNRKLSAAEVILLYQKPFIGTKLRGDVDLYQAYSAQVAAGGTITGDLSKTLGALTLSSAGSVIVGGALSQTLGALTGSAAGTVLVQGALSQTLGALTLSASGGAPAITGDLSATLGAVTLSGAGGVLIQGALSQTLGSISLSGAGTVLVQGALTQTLGALLLSATGSGPGIAGALSKTLGSLSVSATGTVRDQVVTGIIASAQMRVSVGNFQLRFAEPVMRTRTIH